MSFRLCLIRKYLSKEINHSNKFDNLIILLEYDKSCSRDYQKR